MESEFPFDRLKWHTERKKNIPVSMTKFQASFQMEVCTGFNVDMFKYITAQDF
jgi:hypothetical protein